MLHYLALHNVSPQLSTSAAARTQPIFLEILPTGTILIVYTETEGYMINIIFQTFIALLEKGHMQRQNK